MLDTELLFQTSSVFPNIINSQSMNISVTGFGKSDKYTNPDNYTHELHTLVLRKLLDHLDIKEITLVCQDWGGLTGLSVVKVTNPSPLDL